MTQNHPSPDVEVLLAPVQRTVIDDDGMNHLRDQNIVVGFRKVPLDCQLPLQIPLV